MTASASRPDMDDVLAALAFRGTDRQRVDALMQVERRIDQLRLLVDQLPSASAIEIREKSNKLIALIEPFMKAMEEFPHTPDFLFHNTMSRAEWLTNLATLREMAEIGATTAGPSKNFGWKQHLCAFFALVLVCELTGKQPTTTEGGPLRNTASVLFQILTGRGHNDPPDLKRACDCAVKNWREGNAGPFLMTQRAKFGDGTVSG